MSHFGCKIICKLTVLHVNSIIMENKIKSKLTLNAVARRFLVMKARKFYNRNGKAKTKQESSCS
jgi:hypothetical protein